MICPARMKQAGFSILELLMALVILSTATGFIVGMYPRAIGRLESSERRSLAVALSQELMGMIALTPYGDIQAVASNPKLSAGHALFGTCASFDPCSGGSGTILHNFGTIGEATSVYRDFRAEVTVDLGQPPTPLGDMLTITIRVHWLFPGIDPARQDLPGVTYVRRFVKTQ
ncbi:MAG: prepilin-type N-terminal cleavage/methylation domain-containing protein [Candidatus Schekmanbacteria bacterium]|nr:prepilin-type N-terminal cleavage/methylation domain-containing protein [Candidatus Schekmanbacteria bacterium]